MIAGGLWLLAALIVSVGAGLLLFALVRAESTDRPVVDRERAERTARRDVADDE